MPSFGHGHGGLNQRLAQEGDAALVGKRTVIFISVDFPAPFLPQNGVNFTLIDGEGNVIGHR